MTLVFQTIFERVQLDSVPQPSLRSVREEASPSLSSETYQPRACPETPASKKVGKTHRKTDRKIDRKTYQHEPSVFFRKADRREPSVFFSFLSRMASKLGGQLKFLAATQNVPVPLADRSIDSAFFDGRSSLAQGRAGESRQERRLRPYLRPSTIHFWAHYITWDGIVDEVVSLENRETVFGEWWENSLERVYYRLETKAGRELWLFRTAEGDFVHGEFE
jgi:hypothetical protein